MVSFYSITLPDGRYFYRLDGLQWKQSFFLVEGNWELNREETMEESYADLRFILKMIHHQDKVLLIFDFYTQVDSDNLVWYNVIGSHRGSQMNSNSFLLLSHCSEVNLYIINTIFQQVNLQKLAGNIHID